MYIHWHFVGTPTAGKLQAMAKYEKDRSLKIAAATVTASLLIGLGGAFFVRSAAALIIMISLEALLLIGAGVVLSKQDKGH